MFHELRPREQGGRMALERFDSQIRSGVIACLEILDEDQVQKIYCEFHDDVVVQRLINENLVYDFLQVKTKEDIHDPWSLNNLFGINTQGGGSLTPQNLQNSFIGKLLQHITKFGLECNSVIFQTNIVIDKKVAALTESFKGGKLDSKWAELIVENYNEAFNKDGTVLTVAEIIDHLNKLSIEEDVSYLKLNNSTYHSEVRERIFKYSEIELRYSEFNEILIKLENLVLRKSKGPLKNFSFSEIELKTSIGIEDLLHELAISYDAYIALKDGGDLYAIRNASIIQRTLESAGVSPEAITYCSQCKIDWDNWVRENKLDFLDVHGITNVITAEMNKIIDMNQKLKLADLRGAVQISMKKLESKKLLFDLVQDQVLGAFFSQIVKLKS